MKKAEEKKDSALLRAATCWGGFAAVMWRGEDGFLLGRAVTSPNVMPVRAQIMVEDFLRRTGLVKCEE